MRDVPTFYTPMDFSNPPAPTEIHTNTIIEHFRIPAYFVIIQIITLAIAILALFHAV